MKNGGDVFDLPLNMGPARVHAKREMGASFRFPVGRCQLARATKRASSALGV